MTFLSNPIANEIKAEVMEALGAELGEYRRPGLPNIPAIWIGRKIPPDYKVVVSPDDDDVPVSALECIVDTFPDFRLLPSNFRSRAIGEDWRIWLIFHDDRQFPRSAVQAISQRFEIVEILPHLPATNQNPTQYQILISYKNRLGDR
jgi:hypothetical protein